MSGYSVHLQVDEPFAVQVDTEALREAAEQTLITVVAAAPAALSIVITDSQTVQALNAQFRNIDAPTDVLSFPADPDPRTQEPDAPPYLGDVLVALPVAEQQANEAGHSTQDELQFLTVHGVLHLLGYDHATPDEQAKMWAMQSRILDALREGQQ
jgi:probable rRNA maturation factor